MILNKFIPKRSYDLKKFYNSLANNFSEECFDIREEICDGIYLLKNGDIGTFYKITGIDDEILTNKEIEAYFETLSKGMRTILCGIPSGSDLSNTVISFHLSQRRTSSFKNDDSGNVLRDLIEKENNFLYESNPIVKREIYVGIRYCRNLEEDTLLSKAIAMLSEEKLKGSDLKKDVETFQRELENISHNLDRFFDLKIVKTYDLIFITQNILSGGENHCSVGAVSNIQNNIYVKKVVAEADGVSVGGKRKDLFYIEHLPTEFNYGQMRLFLDSIPCTDYDVVWTISHGKAVFGTDLAAKEGWYSGKATRIKEASNFQSFRESVSSADPYCVQSVKFMAHNLDEHCKGAFLSLSMDYLGSRLREETQIPVHILKSFLPLSTQPIENKVKGRSRRVRLENALAFCPIFNNLGKAGRQLWISRSKMETGFDLFAGQGNKMTSLLATTRAGKSVFNSKLLIEFMERNPRGIVRVIDKKSSYQKLSDLVNGRVINFDEDSLKKRPYSPFALKTWDNDDIESLYLLISTAMVQKNKGIKLTACHCEILRESLKLAYNNHLKNIKKSESTGIEIDPHPIWTDILSQMPTACENLRSSGVKGVDSAKDDLSKWSVNLYETGQYGFIFSSHEQDEDETLDQFLTYDLDGISDEVLAQLSAMMAFIKISRDLAKLPRNIPKLIVFEELGMLLHGDSESQKLMDEFIHMVIKTCAKLNAQAIAITNDVKDYTEKAAGKTIWANSSQKIFLPLGDLFPMCKKAWDDQFNEADLQIMESLEKEFHKKRSQAYIISNNEVSPYKGSLYIPLSPLMNAVCTTSGNEVEYYDQLVKGGWKPMDAIKEMASRHPYGEGL